MKMKKILTKAVAITLSLSLVVGSAVALSNVLVAEATSYSDNSHSYVENTDNFNEVSITDFEYDEENDAYIIKSDDTVTSRKGILLDSNKFINYGIIYIWSNGVSNDITLKNIINYGTIEVTSSYDATVTITDSITNYGTITDPNGRISGNIIKFNKIASPTDSGDTTVTLEGKTIPAPQYTVTVPERFSFGDVKRVSENETDANKLEKTDGETVSVDHQYLYQNEKTVSVTMSSDMKIKTANGLNSLDFTINKKTDDTPITTGTTLLQTADADDSETQTESFELYATLDKSTIRTEGNYTGTVTFTVALTDKEAE